MQDLRHYPAILMIWIHTERSWLRSNKSYSANLTVRFLTASLSHANGLSGMFLWVRLVLDSFEHVYSSDHLSSIVDSLPSDLEALYQQILDRICDVASLQRWGGVSRILGLICFAQRPLHKQEILHALVVPSLNSPPQSQDIPVAAILDHCKPLVEERNDGTINLVHFSVKE